MDSSEERFKKRTMRGKYMRELYDDTEDLRREAAALEFAFVDTSGPGDSSKQNTGPSEAEDDENVKLPEGDNPFGTLRAQRRRNVRLLEEMGGGTPATPVDGSAAAPARKAFKRTKTKDGTDANVKKPKKTKTGNLKKSSEDARKPGDATSKKTGTAPEPALGGVQAAATRIELQDARAKQRDLEERLAVLQSEKNAKELQLASALAKIQNLEKTKSKVELESQRETARNLQQSIDSFQRETTDIERQKAELQVGSVNSDSGILRASSSAADSDSSDSDTDSGGMIGSLPADDSVLDVEAIDVKAALAERAKRTKASPATSPRGGTKPASPRDGVTKSSSNPKVTRGKGSSSSISTTADSSVKSASASALRPKRTGSTAAVDNAPAKPDAVMWFKDFYLSSCKQASLAPINDLLLILDRAASKGRRMLELDLNNYEVGIADIGALARAFKATAAEVAKVGGESGVSNLFEPVALDLAHNFIASGIAVIELMEAIGKVVAIDLSFNQWGAKTTQEFAERLSTYTQLKTLKIANNAIGSKAGSSLLKALISSRGLEVLDLSSNALDDRSATALAVVIQQCPLTCLSIKYNKFKSDGVKKLVAAIAHNTTITDLDVTQCGIGDRAKDLLETLESRTNVTKLCLGFNKLPTSFVPRFVSFVAKQKNLTYLDLRGLDLPSKSLRQMIQVVAVNVTTTLHELVLNGNVMDNKCVELTIDYLTRSTALHSLGLRGCGLPKSPLIDLLTAISHSTTLKVIDLSGNKLNDRRILEALGSCLQTNKSLTMIGLAATKLETKTVGVLGQALQFNKTLEKIHIDGNKIGERGLLDFAAGLAGNEVLKVLSIRATATSPRGLVAFLASITAKTQIEVVDAGDNGMPVTNKPFRDRILQFDAVAVKF